MKIRVFLRALALAVAAIQIVAADPKQYKACVQSQVGFDYLLKTVTEVFTQYSQRFNRQFE